jgi:hypothetical protein
LEHSVPMRIMRQLKGRNHADPVDVRSYSNTEDPKVAFYSAIDQLLYLIGPLDIEFAYIFGVYTQSSFETSHKLAWT